ncbi:MAG TPA: carbonic anhydrase [Thermoanaerobaculia bacterium]|jgi:carbonic anhydrase
MKRALFAMLLCALPLFAQEPAPAPITVDQLWTALQKGNEQFVGGKLTYNSLKAERELLRSGQYPPITVLACADSRVPPELVFNQTIGGLFVVRAAGNIADDFGIASIEFALSKGWTKLIVVLAHEDCGAIEASLGIADPTTPALNALALRIRSSFIGIPYDPASKDNMRRAAEANARASVAQLLAASAMIRDAVSKKYIQVIPAYYEMSTGQVKKIE